MELILALFGCFFLIPATRDLTDKRMPWSRSLAGLLIPVLLIALAITLKLVGQ